MITKKLRRILQIPNEYLTVTPPVPKSVKIELTSQCNLKCAFCASSQNLRTKGDIDWDLLCRLLNELKILGVEEIGLFYLGESFLYDRLVDAIAYTKKLKFPYVFLTTNGLLATSEKVSACILAGLDSLKFSFNAADTKQYYEITGIDGYNQLLQNIHQAKIIRDEIHKKHQHYCGLYASSIHYNDDQPSRMETSLNILQSDLDEHYWLPLFGQAGLTSKIMNWQSIHGNTGYLIHPQSPLPCWTLFTATHITFDGYLAACCFDHDYRFNMGDLKECSFMEAWHSSNFQKLRQAHLQKNIMHTPCAACFKK